MTDLLTREKDKEAYYHPLVELTIQKFEKSNKTKAHISMNIANKTSKEYFSAPMNSYVEALELARDKIQHAIDEVTK